MEMVHLLKYDATNDTTASIVAALNDADNVARASANGVTFSAQDGGRSTASCSHWY